MPDGRPIGPPPRTPTVDPPDANAVAAAFGLGEPLRPATFAARGELGRIWRLSTSVGEWAVKVMLEPPDADFSAGMVADVAFQRAAINAGVLAPEPVLSPSGDVLVEVPGAAGAGYVRVHRWVDLMPGPLSAHPCEAAEILGRLHTLELAVDQPIDPWFCEAIPGQRWAELVEASRRADAPWCEVLESRVDELMAVSQIIADAARQPPGAVSTCHCDFNPQNVLVGQDGRAVVVDWENSGPYVAEHELAGALAEFEVAVQDVSEFLAAYEHGRGVCPTLRRSSFAGVLAVQGHLLDHYGSGALDPAAPDEERERREFWMLDMLEHLFTVQRIDTWVDAANT